MHHKVVWLSIIVVLLTLLSTTYAQNPPSAMDDTPPDGEDQFVALNDPAATTTTRRRRTRSTTTPSSTTSSSSSSSGTTASSSPRTTTITTTKRTTRRTTRAYDYPSEQYGSSDYRRKNYRGKYEHDYSRKDDYYNNGYERVIGHDGIDPRQHDGQDKGDFGPIYDDKDDMYGAMDVWISAADDWESDLKYRSRNNYRGNKYNKNRNYKGRDYNKDRDYNKGDDYNNDRDYNNDKDYKDNDRKKRSYSRVRFPVRHFKDIRRFPIKRMPPLISIFPWLPIFYDKITYQTVIFSPTGGLYIMPPLINFYGQRFAVAQLIKWGYASLVSSGAPPPPNINVAPLVQPVAPGGPVTAGVVGSGGSAPAPAPTYDSSKNRFSGGVQTDFPSFKPRYGQNVEEGGYQSGGSVNRNNYGPNSNSNYGGTGRQEVYARGGSGGAGGYNNNNN